MAFDRARRARTCRGSSSSTRSRTRPRRRCGSPTRSATGCTASGSTRPSERGRVTADLVHEVRARLDQAGLPARQDRRLGRPEPGADRLLQGGRRAGRLVRGRVVHQRRHADRLHRRHQGDRRQADRQARPHPRPDRFAAAPAGRPRAPSARRCRLSPPAGRPRSVRPSGMDQRDDGPDEPRADADETERETAYELLQRGHELLEAGTTRRRRSSSSGPTGWSPARARSSRRSAGRTTTPASPSGRAQTFERAARGRPVGPLRALRAGPEPQAARPARGGPDAPAPGGRAEPADRSCTRRARPARPRATGRRGRDAALSQAWTGSDPVRPLDGRLRSRARGTDRRALVGGLDGQLDRPAPRDAAPRRPIGAAPGRCPGHATRAARRSGRCHRAGRPVSSAEQLEPRERDRSVRLVRRASTSRIVVGSKSGAAWTWLTIGGSRASGVGWPANDACRKSSHVPGRVAGASHGRTTTSAGKTAPALGR